MYIYPAPALLLVILYHSIECRSMERVCLYCCLSWVRFIVVVLTQRPLCSIYFML